VQRQKDEIYLLRGEKETLLAAKNVLERRVVMLESKQPTTSLASDVVAIATLHKDLNDRDGKIEFLETCLRGRDTLIERQNNDIQSIIRGRAPILTASHIQISELERRVSNHAEAINRIETRLIKHTNDHLVNQMRP
jgi:hypothetical protein